MQQAGYPVGTLPVERGGTLTVEEGLSGAVQRKTLVTALAAVFGGMTTVLLVTSLTLGEPFVFFVALPLALATYFFWYHGTGRLGERVRRARMREDREREAHRGGPERGGFGAGPRGDWEPPGGRTVHGATDGRSTRGRPGDRAVGGARGRTVREGPTSGPSRTEAYRRLGVDEDASEAEVRRAYRQKVKEVHPDRGGDEEEFKAVTAAYERLVG